MFAKAPLVEQSRAWDYDKLDDDDDDDEYYDYDDDDKPFEARNNLRQSRNEGSCQSQA